MSIVGDRLSVAKSSKGKLAGARSRQLIAATDQTIKSIKQIIFW
jgi:hypothetical protein